MRLKPAEAYLLAFTALFAVLAGFVFWGTWSLSACPVMPDARMTFPVSGYLADVFRSWVANGKFVPWDVTAFIGSPYFWQELQYALAAYFAALGLVYYLKGRGLSRTSCYGAGLLLGFCGYWLTLFSAGHAGWFRWMLFGVFAFGLADRAIRKNKLKNWMLLGACVAWASFYQPDLWLLFTLFTAVYFIWCCVRERKLPCWKGVAVAAVTFLVIGGPSFVGSFRDKEGRDKQIEESKGTSLTGGKTDNDREARWIFVTNWSLPPSETLEFFIPRINGDTSCPNVLSLGRSQHTGVRPYTGALGRPINAKTGNYRQHSLYVGGITCLLALWSVVSVLLRSGAPHRREVLFFAVSALVFWLLSMGRYCESIYRLVFMLPVGDSIRAPVKWHHLTELCLCALAGFGLEALLLKLVATGRVKPILASLAVGAIAILGACDLARVDRLYCAAIDLSVVRARNPAADEIIRRGGGKLVDFMEGGNGIVSWSFGVRRIKVVSDPSDHDVRFAWIPAQQLRNENLMSWMRSKNASLVGTYKVTTKAIRATDSMSANAMLFEFPGAPQIHVAEPEMPPITFVTWLGVFSFVGTIAAAALGVKWS
jgi:hypothetical protein